MKKVLIVASVISFLEWFNKDNILYLKNVQKCVVHIACNLDYFDDTDKENAQRFISSLTEEGIVFYNVKFARNPLKIANFKAYKNLRHIIDNGNYDLIHCHTPAASVITRLAAKKARKKGSIVMYTCHGFHFHNAAPLKNWIIYYPIEKYLSKHCDYIVTINREDFNRASRFKCKNVRYIPGVGVDIKRQGEVAVVGLRVGLR